MNSAIKREAADFARRIGEFRSWAESLKLKQLPSVHGYFDIDTCSRAAITLLLTGAFEEHVKQVFHAFIKSVSKLKLPFSTLPARLQKNHYEGGARVLKAKIASDRMESKRQYPSHYPETAEVARQLASVSTPPYELVWEAFSQTEANMGAKTLGNLLRNVGIEEPWPRLATKTPDFPGIPKLSDDAEDHSNRNNALHALLDQMVAARNRCAHGHHEDAAPQLSSILNYLDATEAVSKAILVVLDDFAASIENSHPKQGSNENAPA